jgi:hypothetical protein
VRGKQLSSTEKLALDVIERQPGIKPIEMLEQLGVMSKSSVSAITSRLVTLRKVNRLKVPMSASFAYFPKDYPLPEGHTTWDNKLVRKEHGNGNGHAAVPSGGKSLITIQYGESESLTFTLEQAQDVYEQLQRFVPVWSAL